MTSTAFAAPTLMTDAQMESQVAGGSITNKGGRILWTLEGTTEVTGGANNGGNGRTGNAAGGLTNARGLTVNFP